MGLNAGQVIYDPDVPIAVVVFEWELPPGTKMLDVQQLVLDVLARVEGLEAVQPKLAHYAVDGRAEAVLDALKPPHEQ